MQPSKTILNYRLSLKRPIFKHGVQHATFFSFPDLPATTCGLGATVLVRNAGLARSPGVRVYGLQRFNWVLLGAEGAARVKARTELRPSLGDRHQFLLAKQSHSFQSPQENLPWPLRLCCACDLWSCSGSCYFLFYFFFLKFVASTGLEASQGRVWLLIPAGSQCLPSTVPHAELVVGK